MRYLLFIFLLSCFICSPSPAQYQLLPEMKSLTSSSVRDSAYIRTLIANGENFIGNNSDSALVLLNKALAWCRRRNFHNGTLRTLDALAMCYAVKGNHRQAADYLQQARSYAMTADKKELAMAYWYKTQSIIYLENGQSDSAIHALQQAVPLATQLRDTSLIIALHSQMAVGWINSKKFDNGIADLQVAEQLALQHGESPLQIYANLCISYFNKKDTAKMHAYAIRTIELARKEKNPRYIRAVSILLADYFIQKGQLDKAAAYANEGISLIDKSTENSSMFVYQSLSVFYFDKKDYNKALDYGNQALAHISEETTLKEETVDLYAHMADIYHALGDDVKAFEYLQEHRRLSDSLNQLDRNKAIDRLEKQYQLSEKEKELTRKDNQILLQQNKVRSRNVWMAIIGGGLLAGFSLSALLFNLYRNSRKKMYIMQQKKEIDELRAMMEGEEKERNRIAIELHDNVGSLLSAASYSMDSLRKGNGSPTETQDLKKIGDIFDEVRNEVRKTAHSLMPDVLLRHSLPEAIRIYCAYIEKDTGLQIDFQSQGQVEDLPTEAQLSLYRMAQELVQNVLKHAAATQIHVQLASGNGIISLTVEDNGKGIDMQQQQDGMGLQNIRNRLKVLNGNIYFDAENGKGTSVYIEIQTPGDYEH